MLTKILRILGLIAMPISLISFIGIEGSTKLGLLSSEQVMFRIVVSLIVGVVGFALVWIADTYKPKTKTPVTEPTPTPTQLYHKCCYCSQYKTCHTLCSKSYEEVIACNRTSLS